MSSHDGKEKREIQETCDDPFLLPDEEFVNHEPGNIVSSQHLEREEGDPGKDKRNELQSFDLSMKNDGKEQIKCHSSLTILSNRENPTAASRSRGNKLKICKSEDSSLVFKEDSCQDSASSSLSKKLSHGSSKQLGKEDLDQTQIKAGRKLSRTIQTLQERLQEQIVQDELRHKPERLHLGSRRLMGKVAGRKASTSRDFSVRRSKSRAKTGSRKALAPLKKLPAPEFKERPYRHWHGISKCVGRDTKYIIASTPSRESVHRYIKTGNTARVQSENPSHLDQFSLDPGRTPKSTDAEKDVPFNDMTQDFQRKLCCLRDSDGYDEHISKLDMFLDGFAHEALENSDGKYYDNKESESMDKSITHGVVYTDGGQMMLDESHKASSGGGVHRNSSVEEKTVTGEQHFEKPLCLPKTDTIVLAEFQTSECDVISGIASPNLQCARKSPLKDKRMRACVAPVLKTALRSRQKSTGQTFSKSNIHKNGTNNSFSNSDSNLEDENEDCDVSHYTTSAASAGVVSVSEKSSLISQEQPKLRPSNMPRPGHGKRWTRAVQRAVEKSTLKAAFKHQKLETEFHVALDKELDVKKPQKHGTTKKYKSVQAVSDFIGALPGQLSFRKGQIIKMLSSESRRNDSEAQETADMCYGYYREGRLRRKRKGLFPSECVADCDEM